MDLVTVDTDEEIGLCAEYNVRLSSIYVQAPSSSVLLQVRALPTVIAFRDGKPVNKFIGVIPEAQIMAFLESL